MPLSENIPQNVNSINLHRVGLEFSENVKSSTSKIYQLLSNKGVVLTIAAAFIMGFIFRFNFKHYRYNKKCTLIVKIGQLAMCNVVLNKIIQSIICLLLKKRNENFIRNDDLRMYRFVNYSGTCVHATALCYLSIHHQDLLKQQGMETHKVTYKNAHQNDKSYDKFINFVNTLSNEPQGVRQMVAKFVQATTGEVLSYCQKVDVIQHVREDIPNHHSPLHMYFATKDIIISDDFVFTRVK